MQTQKDHVQAYTFLMGRMTTALVLGQVSGPEVPARRARTGFVMGVALTVLIMIGFLLYGLIVHQRAEQAQQSAAGSSAQAQPSVAPTPEQQSPERTHAPPPVRTRPST